MTSPADLPSSSLWTEGTDPRAYHAAVKNILVDVATPVLADDTCVPGETAKPKARAAAKGS